MKQLSGPYYVEEEVHINIFDHLEEDTVVVEVSTFEDREKLEAFLDKADRISLNRLEEFLNKY